MFDKYFELYNSPKISNFLIKKIENELTKDIRVMEICGTHTVSFFRTGVRSLLPNKITWCSGPGCPVCVTSQRDIDYFVALSKYKNVIICTFGDLIKVPGSFSSLYYERANGADIRIVYSTFDAIEVAKKNPNKEVVFLGIGFETTAPTVAAVILLAKKMGLKNFFVVSSHKLVPPAIEMLINNFNLKVDAFILPGHVSVIIGARAYKYIFNKHKMPYVITGFDSIDLLESIFKIVNQIKFKKYKLENVYKRAVSNNGNFRAQKLMKKIFKVSDSYWRGIGIIKNSGLDIKGDYKIFDAKEKFDLKIEKSLEPKDCICGEILIGIKIPTECLLYKKICTPLNPIGPCMVSTEGTCATYCRYN